MGDELHALLDAAAKAGRLESFERVASLLQEDEERPAQPKGKRHRYVLYTFPGFNRNPPSYRWRPWAILRARMKLASMVASFDVLELRLIDEQTNEHVFVS